MKTNEEQKYCNHAMDWRQSIKTNNKKTFRVLLIFLITYTLLGLFFDIIFIPHSNEAIAKTFKAYITLKQIPYVTLSLQLIAILAIAWTRLANKRIMLMGTKYKEITDNSTCNKEKQALNILQELKIASSMNYTPKLFVLDAPLMNAFASGWDEKNAIIAITKPLLESLERDELQAVLAHELSHIKHQDIKLTLTVTVLSNIMLILLDLVFRNMLYGQVYSSNNKNSKQYSNNMLILIIAVLRIIIPFLNILLILYLSRTREYMADAGAVKLLRNNSGLAKALLKIQDNFNENKKESEKYNENTAHENLRHQSYIYTPNNKNISTYISDFFGTHPSISKRLDAIGYRKEKL